jgi:hypothetical protein
MPQDRTGPPHQRHLDGSRLQHFTIHRHRRAHDTCGDVDANIGACQRGGEWRSIRRTWLTIGEIEEPIVIGSRQRHRARWATLLCEHRFQSDERR